MTLYKVYTDGGFRRDECRWATVILDQDYKIAWQGSGVLPTEYNKYRQIGGELVAVGKAVDWAANNNAKVHIYHDYTGVANWVADIFGKKPWQCKNDLTKRYRKFMLAKAAHVAGFTWVKGHDGDQWNEYVDQLMWDD